MSAYVSSYLKTPNTSLKLVMTKSSALSIALGVMVTVSIEYPALPAAYKRQRVAERWNALGVPKGIAGPQIRRSHKTLCQADEQDQGKSDVV